jgi:hypothetical protein
MSSRRMAMTHTDEGAWETENPAEVLRNEDGAFEVTSPWGHVFEVTCRRRGKMHVREISEPKQAMEISKVIWRIRRLKQAAA